MTNKEKTFSALNSYFLDTSRMRINETYLNEHIQVMLDNTRHLYDDMRYSKRKPYSIAWEAFILLANECIKMIEYPAIYTCASEQLKKWLAQYGRGYETIAESVAYIEEEREEAKKEKESV